MVLLKKLKPLKKPFFQKRRWSCDFPPRKTPVAQKHRAISRQEKMAFSTPCPVVLGLPSPSRRVCADGRTDGHVTITSQPKFLGSIGYQICLAMELRWRALPAGSTMKSNKTMTKTVILQQNLFLISEELTRAALLPTGIKFRQTTTSSRELQNR